MGNFFEGGYITGEGPPILIAATPFTAVIDLDTGEVLAVSTMNTAPDINQIKALVTEAAAD